MDLMPIYHENIPAFLAEAAAAGPLVRLQHVGMNCGCEYTAFSRFSQCRSYSRYDHSLGVALIVWHFTGNMAQALAGLFHDIATPVFSHVVDFMAGDHMRQEHTESGTDSMILESPQLMKVLNKYRIDPEQVVDYHIYPLADNQSPMLCADRLEYTLANTVNFGLGDHDHASQLYRDIVAGENEYGQQELIFTNQELACRFAMDALTCGRVYVSDEDRYAMQILAELLKEAVQEGILTIQDLYTREATVIEKLCASRLQPAWQAFCRMEKMYRSDTPGQELGWRQIRAKKRYIDPYIRGVGRVSECYPEFSEALAEFLQDPMDAWLRGV